MEIGDPASRLSLSNFRAGEDDGGSDHPGSLNHACIEAQAIIDALADDGEGHGLVDENKKMRDGMKRGHHAPEIPGENGHWVPVSLSISRVFSPWRCFRDPAARCHWPEDNLLLPGLDAAARLFSFCFPSNLGRAALEVVLD